MRGRYILRSIFALITAVTASSMTLEPDVVELDGVLRPWRVVELRSAADGRLARVEVVRGQRVAAGDIAASLGFEVESADLAIARARMERTADLERARAEVRLKRAVFERNEKLLEKGVIFQDQFDVIATELVLAEIKVRQEQEARELARLEFERARARHALGEIRIPVDGVVTDCGRSVGEMVTRGGDTPIMTVAQMHPLRVDVIVPVELIDAVKPGMRAEVVAESLEGRSLTAKVVSVDRVADAASGTFSMRLRIENENFELPAGLKCGVRLRRQ